MRKVKDKIAADLFNALHEANLADALDVDTDRKENDLRPVHSRQCDLYGHLANAIIALGYLEDYQRYIEEGDRPDFCFDQPATEITLFPGAPAEQTVDPRTLDIPDGWKIAELIEDIADNDGPGALRTTQPPAVSKALKICAAEVRDLWHLAHGLRKHIAGQ